MNTLPRLCTTTALATLITTCSALADVTAHQVWSEWQEMIKRTGAEVTFDKAASDGILTINNLFLVFKDEYRPDTTRINIGSLVFQERGDGTVEVLFPQDAPITLESSDVQVTFRQSHKDLSFVVSGSEADLTYSYRAEKLSLMLVNLMVDDKQQPNAAANITMDNLVGMTRKVNADSQKLVQTTIIGELTYNFDISPPNDDGRVASNGTLKTLKFDFDLSFPRGLEDGTMKEAFDAGLSAKSLISYDSVAAAFTLVEKGNTSTGSFASQAGNMRASLGAAAEGLVGLTQGLSFGPLSLNIDGKGENGEILAVDLKLGQIGGNYVINIPDNLDSEQFRTENPPIAKMLHNGMSVRFEAGYNDLDGAFSFNRNGDTASGALASIESGLAISMDRNALQVSGHSKDSQIDLVSPEFPFGPIKVSVAETLQNIVVPVSVTQDPQPFVYHDRVIDLAISDNLWALFDPKEKLPRGPLTYILNVTGTGQWLVDIFDEKFQSEQLTMTKGELHSLALNELRLKVAGVDLTGKGAFTFDNDDLTSYDGIPAPNGMLDMKLSGGNTLLDTLVEMGLLQEEQAMGARMGLGLFTVKGNGRDTLIFHIETTGDGKVLANGLRLK